MPTRPSTSDHRQQALNARRGTAALEFVAVLPVLMVVVVGAADLSRILHYENVLTNAARCGAAYGATHQFSDYTFSNWESAVEQCAAEEAANLPGFDAELLQITVTAIPGADGVDRVQVDVSYPFDLIIDWPGWPQRMTLDRSVTMRGYR